MTEKLQDLQQMPLKEALNPRITPELGFQSYEMLNGNVDERSRQKQMFIDGEIMNPVIDYPDLDRAKLRRGISTLNNVLSLAEVQEDKDLGAAVWDTTSYRMAEMYWLQASADMIDSHSYMTLEKLDEAAAAVQELNEQLYGVPEAEVTTQVLNELWAQIDDKQLIGTAVALKRDLEEGFTATINGIETYVAPLPRPVGGERLPNASGLLAALKAEMLEKHADVKQLIDDYYEKHIDNRAEDERVFTPDDALKIFQAALKLRDPNGTSGVTAVMKDEASLLSWETPLMSVVVGGQRKPIKTKDEMFAKYIHEGGIHGERSIWGIDTDAPILGTGVYSDADPGELSDYLTFEEGFATLCEYSITKGDNLWDAGTIDKYLAVALAYEGRDFRQVHEVLWRVRTLMKLKSAAPLNDTAINSAKNAAYTSNLRINRSTPTDMPRIGSNGQPRPLTFNKDLSYMKGKLLGIKFYEKYKDDPEILALTYRAKIDPMNWRQLALAQKYSS